MFWNHCAAVFLILASCLLAINIFLASWILQMTSIANQRDRFLNPLGAHDGRIYLNKALVTANISSDQTLDLHGQKISIRNVDGSAVSLSEDGLVEIHSKSFVVRDERKTTSFRVNRRGVEFTVPKIRLKGKAALPTALQLRHLSTFTTDSMKIESSTSSIHMSAANQTTLSSAAGLLKVAAGQSLTLAGKSKIILDTDALHLMTTNLRPFDNYQLCICGSGKVYLADPATGACKQTGVCDN